MLLVADVSHNYLKFVGALQNLITEMVFPAVPTAIYMDIGTISLGYL